MLSSLWVHEQYQGTVLGFKVKEVIYREKSKYQMVEIFDTEDWGKILILDGCIMLTERDDIKLIMWTSSYPQEIQEG